MNIAYSYYKKLSQKAFTRNVLTILSGTAGAQLISIAFAPIIARIYGPSNLGTLGSFMAIVAIITPIAALTLPIAIVLPKYDQDAKALVNICLSLAGTIACALFILLFFFRVFL